MFQSSKIFIIMRLYLLCALLLLGLVGFHDDIDLKNKQHSIISNCNFNSTCISAIPFKNLVLPAYCQSKNPRASAWVIRQSHVLLGTDIQIFITPKGFKWQSTKSGLTISMVAPDWKTVSYNTVSRRIYSCSAESFVSPVTKLDIICCGVNWSKLTMEKVRSTTTNGITIDHFKTHNPIPTMYRTDYWVSPTIKLPKPALKVLRTLYNAPNLKGLPTKQMYKREKHSNPKVGFQTLSIERKLVPISTFNLPKNYKKVNSTYNLYGNDTHEQGLDLFLKK